MRHLQLQSCRVAYRVHFMSVLAVTMLAKPLMLASGLPQLTLKAELQSHTSSTHHTRLQLFTFSSPASRSTTATKTSIPTTLERSLIYLLGAILLRLYIRHVAAVQGLTLL